MKQSNASASESLSKITICLRHHLIRDVRLVGEIISVNTETVLSFDTHQADKTKSYGKESQEKVINRPDKLELERATNAQTLDYHIPSQVSGSTTFCNGSPALIAISPITRGLMHPIGNTHLICAFEARPPQDGGWCIYFNSIDPVKRTMYTRWHVTYHQKNQDLHVGTDTGNSTHRKFRLGHWNGGKLIDSKKLLNHRECTLCALLHAEATALLTLCKHVPSTV
jgi:hypothetical protein